MPNVNVRPIGARVLLKRIQLNKSPIVLPESNEVKDWKLITAEVIEVGDGAYLENGDKVPVSVKPGDVVLVPHSLGYTIRQNDEPYTMLNERDIVCVIEEKSKVKVE